MTFTNMLKSAAAVAVLLGTTAVLSDAAQAATVSRSRTLSVAGMTPYSVGNGAYVYTNTPTAVTAFSYSTGSSSGSVTTLSVGP